MSMMISRAYWNPPPVDKLSGVTQRLSAKLRAYRSTQASPIPIVLVEAKALDSTGVLGGDTPPIECQVFEEAVYAVRGDGVGEMAGGGVYEGREGAAGAGKQVNPTRGESL
jgi:hypothetical protein